MNKKGQLDEVNPIAIAAGVIGVVFGTYMMKQVPQVALLWKIFSIIACGVGGYLVMNWQLNRD